MMEEKDAMNLQVVNIDDLEKLIGQYLYILVEEDGIVKEKITSPLSSFHNNYSDNTVYLSQKYSLPESLDFDEETGNIPGILKEI